LLPLFTTNLLPPPTVSVPLFEKFPWVVKLAPPAISKRLPVLMVESGARMFPPEGSTIFAPDPVRVMLAASVVMVFPVAPNCSVP